ncbi:hypothetical protein M8J77_006169 [Diaphorina citri]|nr:hypothetical protein M8J77_006169 [Diaphorina citri]
MEDEGGTDSDRQTRMNTFYTRGGHNVRETPTLCDSLIMVHTNFSEDQNFHENSEDCRPKISPAAWLAPNRLCGLPKEKQGQGILCQNKMVHILSTLSKEQEKRVILCPNKMVNFVHPCLAIDSILSTFCPPLSGHRQCHVLYNGVCNEQRGSGKWSQ